MEIKKNSIPVILSPTAASSTILFDLISVIYSVRLLAAKRYWFSYSQTNKIDSGNEKVCCKIGAAATHDHAVTVPPYIYVLIRE